MPSAIKETVGTDWAAMAVRALAAAGITVAQAAAMTDCELLRVGNIGKRRLAAFRQAFRLPD